VSNIVFSTTELCLHTWNTINKCKSYILLTIYNNGTNTIVTFGACRGTLVTSMSASPFCTTASLPEPPVVHNKICIYYTVHHGWLKFSFDLSFFLGPTFKFIHDFIQNYFRRIWSSVNLNKTVQGQCHTVRVLATYSYSSLRMETALWRRYTIFVIKSSFNLWKKKKKRSRALQIIRV